MKRWILTVGVLGVVAVGTTAGIAMATGGGKTDTQKVAAWSAAWQSDPGVAAFEAELSGDLNADTCPLAIADGERLIGNHPKAPFGEQHLRGMIVNELAEARASCAGDTDGTIRYAGLAVNELTALADELLAHGATTGTLTGK